MSTIVTRAGKGSALTHTEVDANFTNLNTDKIQSGNTVASLTVTSISGTTATYTNATISSADINGGTIDGTSIGSSSASTGAFTTLSASSTVSGTGFSNYLASPPAIGGSTPAAITGTTITANTAFSGPLNGSVGATTPAAGTFTSLTDSGNLTFTGTGNRITGDFTNATLANRVAFQTSTVNGATTVNIIPNGTSQISSLVLNSTSTITDASTAQLVVTDAESSFRAGRNGTGTYLPMTFHTGGSERMRVDTSGNVGIGTSSPGAKLDVRGSSTFLVNATNPTAWISVDSALTTGSMYNQWNTTSNLGISGTYTNHPYVFVTNNTERARIDSSGRFLVGKTNDSFNTRGIELRRPVDGNMLQVTGDNDICRFMVAQGTTGVKGILLFYHNSDSNLIGTITTNGSSTSYNTSSDYRLKHDIQPMTGALAKVTQLKPVTYKWNVDDSESQGFIAHELQVVVPDCVTGEKDAVDADGNPVYQGIDTSFLVATLTAAIQEQQVMIEELKAKVAALEEK
jgi:hypothetical protein